MARLGLKKCLTILLPALSTRGSSERFNEPIRRRVRRNGPATFVAKVSGDRRASVKGDSEAALESHAADLALGAGDKAPFLRS